MVPDQDVAAELVAGFSTGALSRKGPVTVFSTKAEAEHTGFLIARVIRHVRYGQNHTWVAPSPWHAAIWLHNVAAGVPVKECVWPAPGDETLLFESALLFRGQRKAQWEVSPSLFRDTAEVCVSDVAGQQVGDQLEGRVRARIESLNRFVLALGWLTSTDVDIIRPLPPAVHIATAQHYGLPTLSWTSRRIRSSPRGLPAQVPQKKTPQQFTGSRSPMPILSSR